jgi:hypothetical protein
MEPIFNTVLPTEVITLQENMSGKVYSNLKDLTFSQHIIYALRHLVGF